MNTLNNTTHKSQRYPINNAIGKAYTSITGYSTMLTKEHDNPGNSVSDVPHNMISDAVELDVHGAKPFKEQAETEQ